MNCRIDIIDKTPVTPHFTCCPCKLQVDTRIGDIQICIAVPDSWKYKSTASIDILVILYLISSELGHLKHIKSGAKHN